MNELNRKVGELLVFISEVAISARMNTSYNRSSIENKETPRSAMWLVDMLHNFQGIGGAMAENNTDVLLKEIKILKNTWKRNKEDITYSLSVNEHDHDWSVENGIKLLSDIEDLFLTQELPNQKN